ncbi:hypothetical protein CFP56_017138 [Quercus suber]|uniref:Uncharacterized protein n=1 Tax=Quercus suber TaxID=58331 RepID=A0AAW0M3D2_QUESU
MVLVRFWFDKLINNLKICFFSPLQITFPHIYVILEFSEGARLNSYHRRTDWTPSVDRYYIDLIHSLGYLEVADYIVMLEGKVVHLRLQVDTV